MGNLQDEFKKELKMETRVTSDKNIFAVPLPEECEAWEVSGVDMFYVSNVEDEYFGKLNGKYVYSIPRGASVKRRKIDMATRKYMVRDGKFVYEDVSVPSESKVIVSEEMLGLPYKYKSDGYGYVDNFVKREKRCDDNGNLSGVQVRKYIYIVKKENLFPVNQTALVVSVKNMKNYDGSGYLTWNMGTIFLHVIPYNPNAKYTGSRVLKTGTTLDYSSEVSEIVYYWQYGCRFIPDISLCDVGDENLVMKPTITGYMDYNAVELLSLADREVYGQEEVK